jgi:hypothetical protein
MTEYALPSTVERADNIAAGPDGQLWFTADLDYLIGHGPACGLGLSLDLAGTTLTMNFDVGTSVAANLKAWHVNVDGIREVFSDSFGPTPLPVPVSHSITVDPRTGIQGIESELISLTNEPLCSQGAFVNTGGSGSTISDLQRMIAASGIVPRP